MKTSTQKTAKELLEKEPLEQSYWMIPMLGYCFLMFLIFLMIYSV